MAEDKDVAAASEDQSQTDTEDRSAQDDLDSILAEYDSEAQTQPSQDDKAEKKDASDDGKLDKVLSSIEEWEKKEQARAYREAMDESINAIKGEDLELDNELIEGWLNYKASQDSRISQAYVDRHNKPQVWNRTLKALRNELVNKSSKVDKDATSDSEAIASSMRSASSSKSEQKTISKEDLDKMSDKEFFEAYERGDLLPQ